MLRPFICMLCLWLAGWCSCISLLTSVLSARGNHIQGCVGDVSPCSQITLPNGVLTNQCKFSMWMDGLPWVGTAFQNSLQNYFTCLGGNLHLPILRFHDNPSLHRHGAPIENLHMLLISKTLRSQVSTPHPTPTPTWSWISQTVSKTLRSPSLYTPTPTPTPTWSCISQTVQLQASKREIEKCSWAQERRK